MVEFLVGIEGIDRYEAVWETPLVTALRWQMAYGERNGQRQDWGTSEIDRLLERLPNV